MGKSELSKAVDEAVEKITGKKYCQSCTRPMPIEGGADIIKRGRRYGWRCKACVIRQKTRADG